MHPFRKYLSLIATLAISILPLLVVQTASAAYAIPSTNAGTSSSYGTVLGTNGASVFFVSTTDLTGATLMDGINACSSLSVNGMGGWNVIRNYNTGYGDGGSSVNEFSMAAPYMPTGTLYLLDSGNGYLSRPSDTSFGTVNYGFTYGQALSGKVRCVNHTSDYAINSAPSLNFIAAGNVNASNSGSFYIDTYGITDSDNGQTLTYEYQFDGTSSTWTSITTTTSPKSNVAYLATGISAVSLSQGPHTVYFRVSDPYSSSPPRSTSFTVDTLAPTITVANPTTAAAQSKTITASGSDTNTVTLTMAVGTTTTCNGTRTFGAYSSVTFSDESDNGKYVCYRATDSAGNAAYAISAAIAGIDTTAPSITITNPSTSAAQSKIVTASGSDLNAVTLAMNVNAGGICNGTLSFSAYSSTTFSSESDNGKTVCYRATDSAGNVAYSISSAIAGIDTTAPSIAIANPTSASEQSKTITASGSDINTLTLTMSIGTTTTCNATRTFGAYSSVTFNSETDNGKYVCYGASDAAGNVSYSLSAVISGIDTTAPVITVVDPSAAIAPSKSVSASANEGSISYAVNASGIATCNGTLAFSTYSGALAFSSISDNGKSVCFRASDTAGNVSYSLSAVLANIDTLPSLAGLSAASPYVNLSNSGSVAFTLTGITDPDVGQTLTYSYSFDNSAFVPLSPTEISPKTNSTYSFSINASGRSDGPVTVYVRASDSMGNSNTVSAAVTKDAVVPTVAISFFPTVNVANETAVTVSGTCSENGRMVSVSVGSVSDVATCGSGTWSVTLDLSSLADSASLTATADISDTAGNDAVQASDAALKDTVAPTVSVVNPDTTPAQSKTITASGSDLNTLTLTMSIGTTGICNGTRTFGAYSSVTFSSEGDNGKSICFRATDAAGNAAYSLSSAIAGIDTTAPAIAIADPDTTPAQSKTITASGSDLNTLTLTMSIGTTATCDSSRTFSAYASTTFSSEGDNGKYVCYRATDAAGNVSYEISAEISGIDTAPPVITVVDPSAAIAPSKSVSASANEGTLSYAVNASGSVSCGSGSSFAGYSSAISFTSIADNGKSVCFRATDAAGNTTYELSSALSGIDHVTTISGVASGAAFVNVSNSWSVAFSLTGITDPDAGQALTFSYSWDGTAFVPLSPTETTPKAGTTYAFDLNASGRPDGPVTVYVKANDSMADSNTVSVTLVKDTAVPTVSVSSFPTVNASNASAVTISGTCSENGGSVFVRVGSVSDTAACSSGSWSTVLDLSGVADSSSIAALADISDDAGNDAPQATRSALKDTVVPTVAISSFPTVNVANETAVTVSGTCSENGRMVSVSVGSVSDVATCSSGTWSVTLDLSSLADSASVTATADISDAAGNDAVQASETALKDTAAPTISVTNPAPGIDPVKTYSASSNEGALSYSVFRSATPACDSSRTFTAYSGSISFSDISDNGQYVCFRATDAAGNVSYGLSEQLTGTDTPPAISSLRTNATANPVGITTLYPTFSWTFTDTDAGDWQSAYRVVVSRSGSTVWDSGKTTSSGSSAGFVGSTLALDGRAYSVTLQTWDSQDVVSNSLSWSFVMLGVPTVPTGFSASGIAVSGASYSWSDNSSAQYQEDSFSIEDSGTGATLLSADDSSWTEIGLVANTRYLRKVCATNAAGKSCSDPVDFHTLAVDPSGADAIADYDSTKGQTIQLSWNKNGNSTTNVYSGTTLVYSGALSTFEMTHLSADTTYSFVIRSVNGDRIESSGSDSASVVTLPAAPDVSASIPASSPFNSGSVTFSNNASGISGYRYVWDTSSGTTVLSTSSLWSNIAIDKALTPASDGDWYLHVVAVNASGSLGTVQADYGPYSYDTTPPAQLTAYKFVQTSQDGFSFSGTCSTESGGAVEIRDGTTLLTSIPTTGQCRIAYSGTGLPSGTRNVTAYAVDRAGNRGVPSSLTLENYDAGAILTPADGSSVSPVFSITGFGRPSSGVRILNGAGAAIATGSTDIYGRFALQVSNAQPLGALVIDVETDGVRRHSPVSVTVASSSVHTPSITNVADFSEITSKIPNIKLSGEPLSGVRVYARDQDGAIIEIGSTQLSFSGTGEIVSSVELPAGENIVYVVDDTFALSSQIRRIVLVDPWGYVYDSTNRQGISGAKITIYNSSGSVVALPTVNGTPQANPSFTNSEGYYGTYELPGTYRIVAEKDGYTFQSTRVLSGSNNLDGSSNIGSHGQFFRVDSTILRIDIPMDPIPPAPVSSGGGGSVSAGAPLPVKTKTGVTLPVEEASETPTATGAVVDHILEQPCYAVADPSYIDNSGIAWFSGALEKMISCGIIVDGVVIEKSDKVYRYDILRMVAQVKKMNVKGYKIPVKTKAFPDMPKTYTDAKLAYMMRANGYLPTAGRANLYKTADAAFLKTVLKKAFGYDATKDLKGKRNIGMADYIEILYKASEYSKHATR